MALNKDFDAFKERMAHGEVQFVFLKKDGSFRIARGTRAPEHIPADQHPKGKRAPSYTALAFFDLDLEEWRGMRIDNFGGFIE